MKSLDPPIALVGPATSSHTNGGVTATQRVFIYGINYAPEPIGVGRYTGEIGAYLVGQGIEVEVVTAVPHYPGWAVRDGYRNRFSVERLAGARVTRCPILLKTEMRGIWRAIAPFTFALTSAPVAIWRILKTRPDTVLCVEPTLLSVPAALFAAKIVGARTVLHVQDLEIDAAFAVGHLRGHVVRKIAIMVERAILRAFDAVVTISSRMQSHLESKGIAPQRLNLVRNWVDLEKIKPLNGVSSYREELGIPTESFVALYAGNIGPKQALPIVLEAATHLMNETKVIFVIVGDGPEKSRLLRQYGHLPNVRFLPVQPEARLCELLNFANVHLLPQDRGAADLVLPSKLGGMLASERPCIVMADKGTELCEFLGTGAITLPPGNSQALVEAIKKIFHTPNCIDVSRNRVRVATLDAKKNLSMFRAILVHPK